MNHLCGDCGQRQAEFHSIKIINGIQQHRHLCAVCQSKIKSDFSNIKTAVDMLFSNFASFANESDMPKTRSLVCTMCGITSDDFINTGILGCSNCYNVFNEYLIPVIKKVQSGATSHRGKLSANENFSINNNSNDDYARLALELRRAVEHERYEEAAAIKEKLNKLKAGE